MTGRLLQIVFGLCFILLLLVVAWAVVMYLGWSLWAIAPVFIAFLGVIAFSRWSYRTWCGWRLRKTLLASSPGTKQDETPQLFEQQWQAGMQVLKEGRLGGSKGSLYALPWLLMLDVVPPTEQDELQALSVQQAQDTDTSVGLRWCFLKSAMMLRFPILDLQKQEKQQMMYWQLLLKKLNKTRRREPLNGVVFNINTTWLNQASTADLQQVGHQLRVQMDDINRVFNARIPCWVVFSQSQDMLGFGELLSVLPDDQKQHSFGFHEEQRNRHIPEFIQQGFNQVLHRATDLCIWLGAIRLEAVPLFELPEAIRHYETPLRHVLIPAFESTPYAVNPLLKGVYWTGATKKDRLVEPWFAQQLYEQLLPYQRHTWETVDRLGPWRRILKQAVVVVWFGFAVALVLFFLYAARDVRLVAQQLEIRSLHQLDFSAGIESDLQELNTLHDAILQLEKNTKGVMRFLPFRSHLVDLEKQLKKRFVQLYKREIRYDFMDGLVLDQLPYVIKQGSAMDIAAWAQYLVRRINHVQARIDGLNLANQPLIGPEFALLYAQVNPQVGLQTGSLLGQLYPDYLLWQQDLSELQSELDSLKATLRQLNLGLRQIDWLLAWVDLQNDLVPITLADFWPISSSASGPKIPAGLTKAGTVAIDGFVKEIGLATGDFEFWVQRSEKMNTLFVQAAYDAWYGFLTDFDQGRNYLEGERGWKSVLSLSFSSNDPYVKLLHTLGIVFSEVPLEQRPNWIRVAIELDRLIKTADMNMSANSGWLEQVKTINELGHIGWQVLEEQRSVVKSIDSVTDGIQAVEQLRLYEEFVQVAAAQMLVGSGNALNFAEHTWSYGYDPTITESPLHLAQQHFNVLRADVTKGEIREGAVWRIANGPLSFALEYAARNAACSLQEKWNDQVLSVVENVHSQLLAQDLLYGDKGSVEAFMKSTLLPFVDRDRTRYIPRSVLGLSIPLNGEFFAYLNTVPTQQASDAVGKFEQEHLQQQQKLQLEALQQQEKELENQAAQLQKLQAIVAIEMTPALVNSQAKRLPQKTSLTLFCAPKSRTAENYNFPTQQVFDWDVENCADTKIQLQFPEWSLEKNYTGKLGFIAFLRDFQSGVKEFTAADFPGSENLLIDAAISSITLRWRLQGQDAVLAQVDQKQKIEADLGKVRAMIHSVRQVQLEASPLLQPLVQVQDLIPEKITHQCWFSYAPIYAPALDEAATNRVRSLSLVEFENTPTLEASEQVIVSESKKTNQASVGWAIHVGVFANPKLAQTQLEALGIPYEVQEVTVKHKTSYLVVATGYDSQDEAKQTADEIALAMKLTPQVVNAH